MNQTEKEFIDKNTEKLAEIIDEGKPTNEEVYSFKIKPVWLFQSIEVEVKATKSEIPKVLDLYSDLLAGLMKIAPEQEKKIDQKPAVKLASDSQKEIMRKFDIKFTAETTAAEAQKLIQASIDKANK